MHSLVDNIVIKDGDGTYILLLLPMFFYYFTLKCLSLNSGLWKTRQLIRFEVLITLRDIICGDFG